jgi:hypothetical protein
MSPQEEETSELARALRKLESEVSALRSRLFSTTLLLGGTLILLLTVVLTPLGTWVQNRLPWSTQKSTTVEAEEIVAKRFVVRDGENELAVLGVNKWDVKDRAALYIGDKGPITYQGTWAAFGWVADSSEVRHPELIFQERHGPYEADGKYRLFRRTYPPWNQEWDLWKVVP